MTGRHVHRTCAPIALGIAVALVGALAPASPAQAEGKATADVQRAAALSAVDQRIVAKIAERATDRRLGRDVSIRITDPAKRLTLVSSRASDSQLPASNMKVVTAYAALTALGPKDRPDTTVRADAARTRVTLVGGGDPMLTDDRLSLLAYRTVAALAAASPSRKAPTSVRVYFDDTLFGNAVPARGWKASYSPVDVNPVVALQRFRTSTMTPGRDAATVFARSLTNRGVRASVVTRARHASDKSVAKVGGATVEQAVTWMLKPSDNDIAEQLARKVALATGRTPTWAGWSGAAISLLREAGVPTAGVTIVDGSGLSRANRLTAVTMASLLGRIRLSDDSRYAAFSGALPVAGRDGTLAAKYGRFTTAPASCAAGRVFAKTGTLPGALALSGYAIARDGRVRVFSFIVNQPPASSSNTDVRRALDRLVATVVGCT